MCIEGLSNNLYPFNKNSASLIVTSTLFLSVVSGALIGVAYMMQWGIPAIGLLASTSGVLMIITIGLIMMLENSKKQMAQEEAKKVADQNLKPYLETELPLAKPCSISPSNFHDREVMICHQLLALVRAGAIEEFEDAIKLYNRENSTIIFVEHACIPIYETSESWAALKENETGYSLFHYILRLKDRSYKKQLLELVIPKLENVPILIYEKGSVSSDLAQDYFVIQDRCCIGHIIRYPKNKDAMMSLISEANRFFYSEANPWDTMYQQIILT